MARILRGGGRGGATRLKVYLSLLWLARNRASASGRFPYPAQHLAALLGLPSPDGAGARRIQEALAGSTPRASSHWTAAPAKAAELRTLSDLAAPLFYGPRFLNLALCGAQAR